MLIKKGKQLGGRANSQPKARRLARFARPERIVCAVASYPVFRTKFALNQNPGFSHGVAMGLLLPGEFVKPVEVVAMGDSGHGSSGFGWFK